MLNDSHENLMINDTHKKLIIKDKNLLLQSFL
jgi:hypothetical protein